MVSRNIEVADSTWALVTNEILGVQEREDLGRFSSFQPYTTLKDGPSCLRFFNTKEEQVSEGRHTKFSSDMFDFKDSQMSVILKY